MSWRLSDEILHKFSRELEDSYRAIEEAAESIKGILRWKEMPEPSNCNIYGVDGSRGIEKLSGLVIYAVSGVAVGDDILELHEITSLKPYRYIEERIRLHMHLTELRVACAADDADLILLDGTLSGALIRPPAYIDEFSRRKHRELAKNYELQDLIDGFIEVLESWWEEVISNIKEGRARKDFLLSRSEYFYKIERSYRIQKSDINNLMIFLEYVEYLHSLDKLLNKDVVFVAKNFYTNEIADSPLTDVPVLEMLALKQFGEERAAYIPFRYSNSTNLPEVGKKFRNILEASRNLAAAFVRFVDNGNIYLLESNKKIDDELISKLRSVEAEGYILPLIHAHKYAEIKRREMKKIISVLLNATSKPEYRFLFKKGRDVLE